MKSKQYFMAPDCPNCGQKDETWGLMGARISSTLWGHNYSCCSEKCGVAFLNSQKHKDMEKQNNQRRIDSLKAQIKTLEDKP